MTSNPAKTRRDSLSDAEKASIISRGGYVPASVRERLLATFMFAAGPLTLLFVLGWLAGKVTVVDYLIVMGGVAALLVAFEAVLRVVTVVFARAGTHEGRRKAGHDERGIVVVEILGLVIVVPLFMAIPFVLFGLGPASGLPMIDRVGVVAILLTSAGLACSLVSLTLNAAVSKSSSEARNNETADADV